jgi:LysM repeat protein
MSYTVAKGDTLSSIASKLGVSLAALEKANPMPNFNQISPGRVLTVPGSTAKAAPGAAPVAHRTTMRCKLRSTRTALSVFAQSNPELRHPRPSGLRSVGCGPFPAGAVGHELVQDAQRHAEADRGSEATDPGVNNVAFA